MNTAQHLKLHAQPHKQRYSVTRLKTKQSNIFMTANDIMNEV